MQSAKSRACGIKGLATAVACSAVPCAEATLIDVESGLTEPASSSQLVVLVNPELHRPETVLLQNSSPPGSTERIDRIFTDVPDEFFAIGIASDQSVFVTFSDPTIALGLSFESVFTGFSQATIFDLLLAGGAGLTDFYDFASQLQGVGTLFGGSATAVRFGPGIEIGSFTVTIVPAPGAATLSLVCGVGLAYRRRRPGVNV